MESIMNEIWMGLIQYICVPYLMVFMLLSYLVKRYFGELLKRVTGMRWKTVYAVLIIATLTSIPFLVFTVLQWETVLLSYALGTSLHELVFEWFEKLFKKKKP